MFDMSSLGVGVGLGVMSIPGIEDILPGVGDGVGVIFIPGIDDMSGVGVGDADIFIAGIASGFPPTTIVPHMPPLAWFRTEQKYRKVPSAFAFTVISKAS